MAQLGIAGARGVGSALVRLALRAGLEVILFDQNERSLEEARERIARDSETPEGSADGTSSPGAALQITTELNDLAAAEIVIEAVVDSRASKGALITRLDAACPAGTVLATTTGTLSISALAAAATVPERVIGMHFPRPIAGIPVVEVVPGLRTTAATIDRVMALARSLGKTPVLIKNRPGFVVNRLANTLRLEAVRALEEGVADAATIDALLGAVGFSPGPLAAMDAIGLDGCLAISRALFDGALGEPRYQPPLLQLEMVDAGFTGRKAGRGFHEYPTR